MARGSEALLLDHLREQRGDYAALVKAHATARRPAAPPFAVPFGTSARPPNRRCDGQWFNAAVVQENREIDEHELKAADRRQTLKTTYNKPDRLCLLLPGPRL